MRQPLRDSASGLARGLQLRQERARQHAIFEGGLLPYLHPRYRQPEAVSVRGGDAGVCYDSGQQ